MPLLLSVSLQILNDPLLAINDKIKQKEIGIRPGEKLHEEMISNHDSNFTYEYSNYYKILSSTLNNSKINHKRIGNGVKVSSDFTYRSDNNNDWMKIADLKRWIKKNIDFLKT